MWSKVRRFTRIEHTLFSLPLLFAGAWLGTEGRWPHWRTLVLIALVGTGGRTFGMALNRIFDRDLDAKNPRTAGRELPSGKMTLTQAYSVAFAGLALYVLGCALLGPVVLLLAPVPIIPLALYSLLKRFTALCHFGIGVCLALAPLGAFVAVTDSVLFTREVILLAIFTFCWMSGSDMIYAIMDMASDRDHGVRSIPAALGVHGAELVSGLTHLCGVVALVMLWQSMDGVPAGIALVVALIALGAAHVRQIPVHARFFPISAVAGMAGASVVLLGA
jgi:4-hydroxybenzoate polyprenyltransferase